MSDKLPPHSLEAEMSVLGSVLIDQDALIEVAGWLRPEHFYQKNHSLIFEAMLELYEQQQPIDLLTLAEQLKKHKRLKIIGGSAYLTQLANRVPTAANVAEYAKIVRDYAWKRNLISAAGKLAELGFDTSQEARKCLDQAEQLIFGLSEQHQSKNFVAVKEVLNSSLERLDEILKHSDGLRGVPTGFPDLDDALAGMQPSNLIILAARPGMGKTTLALNVAHHVGVNHKIPVGIFSLEMSSEELVDRLLIAQADIDAWKLKTGKHLGQDELTRVTQAMGELAEAPIFIDDTPGLSILEIRTRARRLKMAHDIQLLIVDYLQLAHAGRRIDNRVQEVGEISQGLKNIARELKIPVLALSQLSRAVEQRGTKRPQLADLRESGSIEQDADVVMFLWREDEEDLTRINLSIEKHRNGPLRTVKLFFKGERIRFYAVETKHTQA